MLYNGKFFLPYNQTLSITADVSATKMTRSLTTLFETYSDGGLRFIQMEVESFHG